MHNGQALANHWQLHLTYHATRELLILSMNNTVLAFIDHNEDGMINNMPYAEVEELLQHENEAQQLCFGALGHMEQNVQALFRSRPTYVRSRQQMVAIIDVRDRYNYDGQVWMVQSYNPERAEIMALAQLHNFHFFAATPLLGEHPPPPQFNV